MVKRILVWHCFSYVFPNSLLLVLSTISIPLICQGKNKTLSLIKHIVQVGLYESHLN